MSIILSHIKRFIILVMVLMIGCSPFNVLASAAPTVEQIVSSTVEVTDGSGTWSGAIIRRKGEKLYILTVLHDSELMRLKMALGIQHFLVRINGDETQSARLVKWDFCSELALLEVVDNHRHNHLQIGLVSPGIGERLLTAGNPLGLGIKYNEGYLSAKNGMYGLCTVWSVYSGGTIQGQTGSPIMTRYGRIVGFLTAVGVETFPVGDETGSMIGIVGIPVYHLGYFIPLSTIRGFLEGVWTEPIVYYTN